MNGKYKKKRKLKNDGVSEIIGTVVLLAVAVASFSVLYVTLSATLITEDSAQVNVIGYIEGNNIVLEHQGGDTLKDNTKIDFVIGGRSQSFTLASSNDNFTFYDGNNNGEWDVGEKITFSSSESFSGLAVDTSVVDTSSNSALFIGSLQEGERNATPVVDLSTVVEMLPFTIDTSPFQINATGSSQLDSVSLYYAFSSSNWTSCSDQRLTYDDFEDGFGNYTSGGSNCDIYTGGSYAHQGDNAIHIQNSGDAASFYLTESVDIDSPNYSTITVDFWFIKNANPGTSRQFTIDYYDGSDWQTIITYSLSEYNNDEFYHETVWINETNYTFPSDMNIRFKGSMPNNNDDVYFDQIYVNASCNGGSSSSEPVWMQYDTDLSSPWSWEFSFSNGTGYYQFYSIGEHDSQVEEAPSTADTMCSYSISSSLEHIAIRVETGNDDAEEDESNGNMYLWSSDLELVNDGDNQEIGIRFNNIDIPQGSTISSANLTFTIDESQTEETNLNIFAHDTDDSTIFSDTDYNISSREKTSSLVQWDSLPSPSVGETMVSPEIKIIIQEIINRPGWSSGNSLSIIINGSGKRTVESYNGDSQKAPLLQISYLTTEDQDEEPEEGSTRSNLISHWKLDENSGTDAFDSSDGNDGVVNGASWTTGVVNSSLLFDGADDFVFIENSENLNFVGNFTAMAWVKWSIDPETGDNWANILNKGEDSQWQIQHSYDNSKFEFALNTDNTRGWVYSSTEVKMDVWYHVAGVYDGSEIRIYVNGTYENQEDLTGNVYVTDYPVNIGRRSVYNDRYFSGVIDEVYLYNRTLSAEELQNYYNQTKSQSSENDARIAHWEFNENTGSIAFDSSGNNNNGSISDASWTTGVSGSALFFDNQGGQDEYVSVSDDNNLDLTTEGSVEAWVKINSYQDYAGIIHKGNQNDFSDEAYTLQFWGSDGTIVFGGNDESGDSLTIESSEELNLDQWYHIVGTWDDSSIKVYINGELDVEESFTIGAIKDTGGSLQIGAQLTENYPGYGYFGFDGIIDQVALYDTALTEDEISNHYDEYQP